MLARGQTTNRAASLYENGHADNKNAPLPSSRHTSHPAFSFQQTFSFQQRPLWKETSAEYVVNKGVVGGEVLPKSRHTSHPAFSFQQTFSFQQRPLWKETSAECVVNKEVIVEEALPKRSVRYLLLSIYQWTQRIIQVPFWTFWAMSVGGIVAKNTWHDREQSHQEAEPLDDSAHQSQRGAITTRVLANLGLKEETENSEQMKELEPTQQLMEVLHCSDSSIRSEAIHRYLEVEFARMALLESNWQQRIVAIRTIGMRGGNDSISPLKICLQDAHEYVRAAAAQAIADIGARTDLGKWLSDTIVTLLVASFDKHWIVRTAVIQAMSTLGQHSVDRQEFINAIIFALDDEECAVRIAAVRALYNLKGKEALPRLELIAKCDFEYLVRDAAQDILQSAELQQTEVL